MGFHSKDCVLAQASSVRSVDRALQLLASVSVHGSTLSDLAAACDLPIATAHRLVDTLLAAGYLRRTEDVGTLVLGPKVTLLAYKIDALAHSRWLVRDSLLRLRDEVGETSAFFLPDRCERVCVDSYESMHPVMVTCPPGKRFPLHVGSTGKAILAFMAPEQVDRILESLDDPIQLTNGQTKTVEALRHELGEVRESGYATSALEATSGAWGVGCPVFGSDGSLFGAIGFIIPITRRSTDLEEELTQACLKGASSLSDALMMISEEVNPDKV